MSILRKQTAEAPSHIKTGRIGEKIAEKYLKKNKYKIIGKNVRVGKSEFDIIGIKDETLVFFEVKTRTMPQNGAPLLSRPADAVNKSKSTYLIRGVNDFCAENCDEYSDYLKRIDIIEVYLKSDGKKTVCAEIKHFENAVKRR